MVPVLVDNAQVIQTLADDVLFCSHWRLFCTVLGFRNAIMVDLERFANRESITEVARQIMIHWKAVGDDEANLNTLCYRLKEIGCMKCAKDIANIIEKNDSKENNMDNTEDQHSGNNVPQNVSLSHKLKKSITKHSAYICENLRDVPSLLIYLRTRDFLRPNEITKLKTLVGVEQIDDLFQTLGKLDCKWEDLRYCLTETGNEHVALKIEEDLEL